MDKDYKKGLKIGLGIMTILGLLFGIVFAIGFHTADEITSGTFTGNYDFSSATVQGLDLVNTTYSYSEINTGKKWVDGKPIYRKVINWSGTMTAGSTYILDATLDNTYIDRITYVFGSSDAYTANGAGSVTLRRVGYQAYTTGLVIRPVVEGWANANYQFIVEYTKK